jgi:hypothetical protein
VVGDVPVDSEALVMTLLILKIYRLSFSKVWTDPKPGSCLGVCYQIRRGQLGKVMQWAIGSSI